MIPCSSEVLRTEQKRMVARHTYQTRSWLSGCSQNMMTNSISSKWIAALHRIFKTQPIEISCDEAMIELARYADQMGESQIPEGRWDDLFHHVSLCVDCAAEFQLVKILIAAELNDGCADPELSIPNRPDRS